MPEEYKIIEEEEYRIIEEPSEKMITFFIPFSVLRNDWIQHEFLRLFKSNND